MKSSSYTILGFTVIFWTIIIVSSIFLNQEKTVIFVLMFIATLLLETLKIVIKCYEELENIRYRLSTISCEITKEAAFNAWRDIPKP
jgi:archaellum biogenesis protein FlaJ (TadC family)